MSLVDRGSTVSSGSPFGLLVGILVGVVALLLMAGTASAGSGCGQQVIEDWADDGTISGSYSPACYQEAIASLPEDLRSYSSAAEDINQALQEALLGDSGESRNLAGVGSVTEEPGEAAPPIEPGAATSSGGGDSDGAGAATAEEQGPPESAETPGGEAETTTPAEASAAAAPELDDGGAGLPLPALVLIVAVGCAVVAGLVLAGQRIARGRKGG
jgi:hypothetical protein